MNPPIVIKTHDGCFHADDVFAVVVLEEVIRRAGETSVVIRSRDPDIPADFLVDVGREYDPERGRFDHHQEGGAGYRNTVGGEPYAAFGVVWKHFGPSLCKGYKAANLIDHRLVRHVDVADCGVSTLPSYSISNAIKAFNPCWDDDPHDFDSKFKDACNYARVLLLREMERVVSGVRAEYKVRKAVTKSRKHGIRPDIAFLPQFIPWKSVMANEYPDVRVVVFPDVSGEWIARCTTIKGSGRTHILFPSPWASLSGDELEAETGVPGSVFCHANRFMVVHKTKEGALALAEKALS